MIELTAEEVTVFEGFCKTWWASSASYSCGLAMIQVEGLHGDEFFAIQRGREMSFELEDGITRVKAKAGPDGSGPVNATINCGPIAGRKGR